MSSATYITRTDGQQQIVCTTCCKTFKSSTRYEIHMKRHEPPGGYICKLCDAPFITEELLGKHKHEKHELLICQICNGIFKNLTDYKSHILSVHNGVDRNLHTCPNCEKTYKTKLCLQNHLKASCGALKPWKCDQCELSYATQGNLKTHKLVHAGEKKHCCTYCGKRFLNKGQLVRHERQHTGEKPYKCDLCDKSFAYRESLVTHSSTHTGVKPFVCLCCDERFSCIGNLHKHRRKRPATCGQDKYPASKKIAPVPSMRVPGTMTGSTIKIVAANKIVCKETIDAKGHVDTIIEPKITEITADTAESKTDELFMMEVETLEKIDEEREEKGNGEEGEKVVEVLLAEDSFEEEIEKIEETEDAINEQVEESEQPGNEDVDEAIEGTAIEGEDDNMTIFTIVKKTNEIFEIKLRSDIDPMSLGDTVMDEEPLNVDDDEGPICTISIERESDEKPSESPSSKVFNCPECPKFYERQKRFERHLVQFHSKSPTQVQEILESLGLIEDNNGQLKCKSCKKAFEDQTAFAEHTKTVHGADGKLIHKCPCNCKQFFRTAQEAQQHAFAEHKNDIYCSICDKIYSNPAVLKLHNKSLHTTTDKSPTASTAKKKEHFCRKCNKKFTNKTALNDHELSKCGQTPQYECEHCNKRFHSAGSLKVHILVHTGELPFACPYCEKKFRTKGQNTVHQRTHTKEKPFPCKICDKSFPYRESLITHMATHTGNKRYKCYGCEELFTCISNLRAHRYARPETCGLTEFITKPVGKHMGVQKGEFVIKAKS